MNPRHFFHLVLAVALMLGASAHAAGWSTGTAVSPTGNPDPTRGAQTNSIAVNGTGLAVAAWDQFFYTNGGGSTVGVNVETNGRWGAPQTISTPGKFSYRARAAAGDDGTLIVAWFSETSTSRSIEVSIRETGQTLWSAPMELASGSLAGSPAPGSVQLVMNHRGEAWAAWSIYDGAHDAVQVAYRPAGTGAFLKPQTVSTTGIDAVQPALAINARGDVGVAWAGSPYAMFSSPNVITYRYRSVGGDFGAAVEVLPIQNPYTGYLNSPLVCLDQSGVATVAWMGAGLQASRQIGPIAFDSPQTVSPLIPRASYITPGLACDEQGNATVVVAIFDATVGVQRAQLWANTRAANSSSWSGPVRLTGNNPRKTEDIAASSVAMTPGGSMTLISYVDHYNGLVGAIHRTASGWGNPYTVGKTSNVSSFAETVTAAANGTSAARIIWKTKGGMQHLVSDWRP